MIGANFSKGQKVLEAEDGMGQVWISGFGFANSLPTLRDNKIMAVCSGADLSFDYLHSLNT